MDSPRVWRWIDGSREIIGDICGRIWGRTGRISHVGGRNMVSIRLVDWMDVWRLNFSIEENRWLKLKSSDLHRASSPESFTAAISFSSPCHRSLTSNEEEGETSSSEAVKYPIKISETRMVNPPPLKPPLTYSPCNTVNCKCREIVPGTRWSRQDARG